MLDMFLIKTIVEQVLKPHLIGVKQPSYKSKDVLYLTFYFCLQLGWRQKEIAAYFDVTTSRVYYGQVAAVNFRTVDKIYRQLMNDISDELKIKENEN